MSSVCRICLVDNVEMNYIQNNQILEMYRKFTNAELNSVLKPRGVCYICYSLLRRCCRFSELAHRSEQILTHIISMGYEVNSNNISALDVNIKKVITLSAGPTKSATVGYFEVPHSSNVKKVALAGRPIKSKTVRDFEVPASNVAVKYEPVDVKLEILEAEALFTESTELEDVDITASELIEPTPRVNAEPKLTRIKRDSNTSKDQKLKRKRRPYIRAVGKPKHPCNQCDKRFESNCSLMIHMRTHTGEKPFVCHHCGRSFNREPNLKRHIQVHTGEKPYECKQCGKSFNLNSNLVTHIRLHTGEKPFLCKHCDKSFRNKSNLNKHLRTHTGEKPYKCNVCDKSLSNKKGLESHLRVHTGEKPYLCRHCDKTFNRDNNLRKHMRRMHTGR